MKNHRNACATYLLVSISQKVPNLSIKMNILSMHFAMIEACLGIRWHKCPSPKQWQHSPRPPYQAQRYHREKKGRQTRIAIESQKEGVVATTVVHKPEINVCIDGKLGTTYRPCSLPPPNPKYFLFHPSHQIFRRMHGALNVGKKDN
jgi:hypothetical protein